MRIIVNAPDEVLHRINVGDEFIISGIDRNFDGIVVLSVKLVDKINEIGLKVEVY